MSIPVLVPLADEEGFVLEDEHTTGVCPECRHPAANVTRYWKAEGTLNQYERWCCGTCGYLADTGAP